MTKNKEALRASIRWGITTKMSGLCLYFGYIVILVLSASHCNRISIEGVHSNDREPWRPIDILVRLDRKIEHLSQQISGFEAQCGSKPKTISKHISKVEGAWDFKHLYE